MLILDLARLGIRLAAHGDRLRYAPRSAVTPDLERRLADHKDELLAIVRHAEGEATCGHNDADATWRAILDRIGGDLLFPARVVAGLRAADAQLAPTRESFEIDELPPGSALRDPDDLEPCPRCGTYHLWQTLGGRWRCERCDPPPRIRPRAGQHAPPAIVRIPDDAVCRCGSTKYVDVPIHDGRSVRRDCVRCGRFIEFALWALG